MAVNEQVQDNLARLLAMENIQIHIGKYKTASFNVENRLLLLPTWNTDDKNVSDLLISHEVGHALWTPPSLLDDFSRRYPDIPFCILNIVEDCRIERKIKDKYPGLIRSYHNGYEYLLENNFFKISGDVNDMIFLDRLNLKAKAGSLIDVKFSRKEKELFDRCMQADTVEEVLVLCNDIFEYVNTQKEEEEDSDDDSENGGDESESETEAQSDPSESGDKDKKEISDSNPQDKNKDELNPKTENNLKKSLDEIRNDYDKKTFPVHIGTRESRLKYVLPWRETVKERRENGFFYFIQDLVETKKEFGDFKKSIKNHIQYLVQSFERKKAATSYAKQRFGKTGDLDVNKLHSYKFCEDIFASSIKDNKGKNHGMMFFLDFSGSMLGEILPVIEQTLTLAMFCRAVGIPFSVYTFTGPTSFMVDDRHKGMVESSANELRFDMCNIVEILSSEMNKNEFDLASHEIWLQVKSIIDNKNAFGRATRFCGPGEGELSSTPLFDTIIIAHDLVSDFKKRYKVDIMNTIFLTDGVSNGLSVGYKQDYNEGLTIHHKYTWLSFSPELILNIKGKTIRIGQKKMGQAYRSLIKNLKETCSTNVIGYYITKGGGVKNSISKALLHSPYGKNPSDSEYKEYASYLNRDHALHIPGAYGYDSYFVIKKKSLETEPDEFETDKTSVGQIGRAFIKHNVSKRRSRIFLDKFSDSIS